MTLAAPFLSTPPPHEHCTQCTVYTPLYVHAVYQSGVNKNSFCPFSQRLQLGRVSDGMCCVQCARALNHCTQNGAHEVFTINVQLPPPHPLQLSQVLSGPTYTTPGSVDQPAGSFVCEVFKTLFGFHIQNIIFFRLVLYLFFCKTFLIIIVQSFLSLLSTME